MSNPTERLTLAEGATCLRERWKRIESDRQKRSQVLAFDWTGYELDYANLAGDALTLLARVEAAPEPTFAVTWQRAGEDQRLQCHDLTAERFVNRLRAAIRCSEGPITIHAVAPERAALAPTGPKGGNDGER